MSQFIWKVIGNLLAVVAVVMVVVVVVVVVMVAFNYENFPTNHWRIKCPLYVYPAVRSFMARCLHVVWGKEEDMV